MLQGACQAVDTQPASSRGAPLLAPLWHTQALVALMLLVAATGTWVSAHEQPVAPSAPAMWSVYLPLVTVNVGLSLYVCRLGLRRNIFALLFSRGRYDARRLLGDVGLAAALALLLLSAENGFQTLLGMPESTVAHALLPDTTSAKLAWFCVATLVGFSEELVYRGYLQRQLGALSGQVAFGIVAQALLFGIAHGEQGPWAVARFASYALVLGWVAAWRTSLVPSVLCHVALDCYAAHATLGV